MTEKIKINILIDGRNFTVVSTTDNEDYVRHLAYYVDKKIRELASKNDKLCQTSSATLAAFNIADELFKTKERLIEIEEDTKEPMEKYDKLVHELENTKSTIKNFEAEYFQYKDNYLKSKLEIESFNKEINKYKQALELKERELVESQKMIKSLQGKIYDNQIELIETKKELKEILKLEDNRRRTFIEEEVKTSE